MASYCGRGEWGFGSSVNYALGDVVTCFGLFWQCALAGSSAQPGTNGDWTLLSDPYEQYLRPTALKRETFPRMGAAFANLAPPFLSGQLYGQAISLMAGDLVTSIAFAVGTTASATVTNTWVALYDSGGNLLRQSTSAATVLTANTLQSIALSSTYRITTSGLYYICLMVQATTMPTMIGVSTLSTAITGSTLPRPSLTDTTHVGLTTTAPALLTPANFAFQLYGGVA